MANSKTPKTNAMRILTAKKIKFSTRSYEVDESDLSGVHVAAQIGLDSSQVYKTLVAKGDRTGYLTCGLPVHRNVDLKKLAAVSGNKRVELIPTKDILAVTGYIRGGCSPIGMKKQYPYYLDESVNQQSEIAISAGIRGAQIILSPADLIRAADAVLCSILQPE
ncbi:MAG: Cys-tRNA(Pro) deacylase [Ruminococcaceae bacterium]|nr:Cys-tRNA(Pro) deacylase [Oscillospiraceae bacterium]